MEDTTEAMLSIAMMRMVKNSIKYQTGRLYQNQSSITTAIQNKGKSLFRYSDCTHSNFYKSTNFILWSIEQYHPELAASGLSVSEVNDTESETETELEFDGVTYEMIKTPTPTGSRQPHRTYLLKGRFIERPARKQAIINYLQRQ